MRKSQHIRTYAFLLHDLPMKFSPILPFLTRFRKKACGCSATGFTQKRHTLYAYYSRGKSEFQMIFPPILRLQGLTQNRADQQIRPDLSTNSSLRGALQGLGAIFCIYFFNVKPIERVYMSRLFSVLLIAALSCKYACTACFHFSHQSSISASCLRIAPVAALIS